MMPPVSGSSTIPRRKRVAASRLNVLQYSHAARRVVVLVWVLYRVLRSRLEIASYLKLIELSKLSLFVCLFEYHASLTR